jgi:hypothetical protein
MVLNCIPSRPALSTPSFTLWFRSIRCMLHGLPEYQTDEMPTWALFMSVSLMPVAYSIACEAPCDLGCVMCLLTELSSLSALAVRAAELESARLQTIRLGSRFRGQKKLTLRAIAAAASTLRARELLQSVRETLWRADCSFRGGLLILII